MNDKEIERKVQLTTITSLLKMYRENLEAVRAHFKLEEAQKMELVEIYEKKLKDLQDSNA